MSADLYDGHGYPTDEALERLEHFEGTPAQMAEYVKSLMKMGGAKIEYFTDEWGKDRKRLTLITMGWSGCESVIGVLHKTLFHFAYWQSSERGGLYVYEIPALTWDSPGEWGDPTKTAADRHVGTIDGALLDELDTHSRQAREAVEQ